MVNKLIVAVAGNHLVIEEDGAIVEALQEEMKEMGLNQQKR